MRSCKVTRGPHYDYWVPRYDADTKMAVYLNLARNSFYILFPAKGIMSYRQIISSRFYVCLKGTCSLACRSLPTPVNKLNNVNVNCLKIPKKHRGSHKTSSRAACLRPVAQRQRQKKQQKFIMRSGLRLINSTLHMPVWICSCFSHNSSPVKSWSGMFVFVTFEG